MIDTSRLFESLSRATEFTVTEDHLKLLRHTCGIYWDPRRRLRRAVYQPQEALRQLQRATGRRGDLGGARQRLGGQRRRLAARRRGALQDLAGRCRGPLPASARGGRDGT